MDPIDEPPLVLSLRTHVLADARILARRLTELSDRIFAAMAETMPMPSDLARTLLIEMARFEVAAFEASRALAPQRSAEAAALDLAREAATQDVLRRALLLRDREVAREPLRHVAQRLGAVLDEGTDHWAALAIEATRVLLDVSIERARRDQGLYDAPSEAFRMALEINSPAFNGRQNGAAPRASTPLSPGLAEPMPFAYEVDASTRTSRSSAACQVGPTSTCPHDVSPGRVAGLSEEVRSSRHATDPDPAGTTLIRSSNSMHEAFSHPADPAPTRTEVAHRILRRPPRITVDTRQLSPGSLMAIQKQRGITLREAFDLYYELKALGYPDRFDRKQKIVGNGGPRWVKSSGSAVTCARGIWVDLLGDRPFEDVTSEEVEDALKAIWLLPAVHGKGKWVARDGYRDLIERVDLHEATVAERSLEAVGQSRSVTAADKEAAIVDSREKRIRVDTYLKHARMPARLGRMLEAMQLIDVNPFEICAWTKEEEDLLRRDEDSRARQVWDDRIYELFRSPVFQGFESEPGDPLFWAPLIARHLGLRMEECLQLGPEDFGTEGGLSYLMVRNLPGDQVKSGSAERKMPLHPNLVALGLPKLVEARRHQGQRRLFPHLTRGASKNTYTENFTKAFGYYRRTHNVYWKGLDFHALRSTFHGDLLNDDGSDAIRRRLMGHAPVDEGEKSYAQGLSIEALHERVSRIRVDVSMIKSPFAKSSSGSVEARAARLGLRVAS